MRALLPGKILIEECLTGQEASILVVVSGQDYVILPPAQDHKRVGDGDTGPNGIEIWEALQEFHGPVPETMTASPGRPSKV